MGGFTVTDNDIVVGDSGESLATRLESTVSTAPAGHEVIMIWRGTQAEYNALGTYSPTTLYLIVG